MKRIIIAAMLLVAISMNAQLLGEKYVGGDISMLTQYENAGKAYYDEQGKRLTDVLDFLNHTTGRSTPALSEL